MPSYRVTFDRIGRTKDLAPLVLVARDADDLAGQIAKYARKHLRSRDYNVIVDFTEGNGFIACGMHNGGSFTIAEAA